MNIEEAMRQATLGQMRVVSGHNSFYLRASNGRYIMQTGIDEQIDQIIATLLVHEHKYFLELLDEVKSIRPRLQEASRTNPDPVVAEAEVWASCLGTDRLIAAASEVEGIE